MISYNIVDNVYTILYRLVIGDTITPSIRSMTMTATEEILLKFGITDLGVHVSGTWAHIDIDVEVDEDGDVVDWTPTLAVDDYGRVLKLDKVVEYLGVDLKEAVLTAAQGFDLECLFEDQMDESDVESYYECQDAGASDDVEYGGVDW